MSAEQKAFILDAIKTVGYPIFVSIALGMALFQIGKTQLERQTRFIDSIEITSQQQARSLESVSQSIHQTNLLLEQLKSLFTIEHQKSRDLWAHHHEETRKKIIEDNNRLIEYADKLHEETRKRIQDEDNQKRNNP